ncbi:MAG: hypothetical protein M3R13_00210 [Armatimonadota bacterium]|nr:hypothetical protein [Armatimonadota bacterium]
MFASADAIDDSHYIEMYRDHPIGTWRLDSSTGGSWQNVTAPVYANQNSIRVNVNNNEYFQVRNSWGGLDKSRATALEFYFYADSMLLTGLDLEAASSNNTGPRIRLSTVVTQKIGQWTRVTVPWASLGLTTNSKFRLFRLHNVSGQSMVFNLDEVRVVRSVDLTAGILLDANIVERTVAEPMFGVAGGIFDPYFDYPSTKARVREAGINTLAYPGGTVANNFDWRTNMDIRFNEPAVCTVQAFLKMTDQVGANKIINVNYGSGTPQDARDWVEYANITRQSNVKYWGIGNENYGVWSYDTHPFRHDAVTYAEFAVEAIHLMKAVDPTIQIGIACVYTENTYPQRVSVINPVTGQSANGWTPVVLTYMRNLGVLPDYIDIHYYPQGPYAESDTNLLQTIEHWELVFNPMRRILEEYLGQAAANGIDIFITENNGSYFNPGRQSVSMVTALYLATSWSKVVEMNGKSFVWWRLHQGVEISGNMSQLLYGWRSYGDYGVLARGYPETISPPVNEPYPPFYALKLLKIFARPGYQIVSTTSDNLQVSCIASRNPATGKVNLMLCNLSREGTLTASITPVGVGRNSVVTVFTYGAAEDIAQADIRVWRAGQAEESRVINLRLPPYSINVVEL